MNKDPKDLESKKEPLVGIIMSTFNHGSFIKESIGSVISQNYLNWKLIVVNDGSTDETEQIVLDYKENEERIEYIKNNVNKGVPCSFNLAFSFLENSKYIARIDSDDAWIGNDKLEKQILFLEKNSEYVAVGGGMIVVDKNKKELFRYLKPKEDYDIRMTALVTNPIANSTSVVRSSIVKKVGGVNEKFDFNEDWDFWLKVGLEGKLYNFSDYFSFYTFTGQNKSMVYLNKQALVGLNIISSYKNKYPNFLKGFIINSMQFIYGSVPFFLRKKTDIILSKIKKTLSKSKISLI